MIGDNVKRIRESKGLGLNELARKVNISGSYLSNIEKGIKTNPSMDILKKIADTLQVEFADIFISPENSYSIELLTAIQSAHAKKDNYSTDNILFLDSLSRELNIDSDELFEVYNNKSTDLPLATQSILLNHLKVLDIKAYIDFTIQDTAIVKESEGVYDIDGDMEAIIKALKNASPNKKAKILKMIELFDDEN